MKRTPAKPSSVTPEQCQNIETTVFTVVEKSLEPRFYLLDVSFEKEAGYWYLRIYVEDRQNLVALSDCEAISRKVEPLIDELSILGDLSYSLEVSSPGLFRPLRKSREFEFYQGRPVRIEEVSAPKKGAKKNATAPSKLIQEGLLQDYNEQRRVVTLKSSSSENPLEIELSQDQIVYLNPTIQLPGEDEIEQGE